MTYWIVSVKKKPILFDINKWYIRRVINYKKNKCTICINRNEAHIYHSEITANKAANAFHGYMEVL